MLRTAGTAKTKRLASFFPAVSLTLLIFCIGCFGQFEKSIDAEDAAAQTGTDDFYAYYTRLGYDIPTEDVLGYILRVEEDEEDEEEEEEDEEEEQEQEYEVEEEIEEEEEGRWKGSDPITGRYADIVVNVGKYGQFVFSRESSYLPSWKTPKGKWFVSDLLPREKDIACLYSYVRIIENTPAKILIHWRYMPDLAKLRQADVVHESFTISPDGTVSRQVRQATGWVDEWKVTRQRLKLAADGIREVVLEPEHLVKASFAPIPGAQVKDVAVGEPVAWLRFDEGLAGGGYHTKDAVAGKSCVIEGNKRLWKRGVSGSALAFDGYESKVTLASPESPDYLGEQLSLEAWVVLGAYPWNETAIVHQTNPAGTRPKGYMLGIDDIGRPVMRVCVEGKWQRLVASKALELYRWTHIAGTFDGGVGEMVIYVDGIKSGSLNDVEGDISASPLDIIVGLNNVPAEATHHVTEKIGDVRTIEGSQPWIFGIEGLIDEVRVYNKALSARDVRKSYDGLKPGAKLRDNPDLEKRILPGEVGIAAKFGAQYRRLKYHELWDNLWRTSHWPDIVVKFDEMPVSVVYWRGPNYGPGWVTEKNLWMSDQSVEVGTWCGCSEHMSDKECRFAHVRLIENTDARVVVHWRYASVGIMYNFPNNHAWTDEYHTIYPDAVAIRKVNYHAGGAGWQDTQFLAAPGQRPEDVMNLESVTAANMDGETYVMDWSKGIPRNRLRDGCIQWINFKSEYKVFVIYPGRSFGAWGHRERGDGFGDTRGNMAMYGLTNRSAAELAPLARSWKQAPKLVEAQGCSSEGYIKQERAYRLTAKGPAISFKLQASKASPVVNPCFVIKNWGSDSKAALKVNGKKIEPGKSFRQGIIRDTDGTQTLVIWIKTESTKSIRLTLK
ncbi:MAG: LamG domain-containing protein [Planctomycetota bacterium]